MYQSPELFLRGIKWNSGIHQLPSSFCWISQPLHLFRIYYVKGQYIWCFVHWLLNYKKVLLWELINLILLLLLSRFSRVQLCATPSMQPTRLPCPWDSPGKNTGVSCHFRLQCMKVKCEREVAQSCLTLSNPMGYSLPGSSIHGIF